MCRLCVLSQTAGDRTSSSSAPLTGIEHTVGRVGARCQSFGSATETAAEAAAYGRPPGRSPRQSRRHNYQHGSGVTLRDTPPRQRLRGAVRDRIHTAAATIIGQTGRESGVRPGQQTRAAPGVRWLWSAIELIRIYRAPRAMWSLVSARTGTTPNQAATTQIRSLPSARSPRPQRPLRVQINRTAYKTGKETT
ncbi:hypothetical protein PHIN109289_01245 [Phaeobacter inhibens]